MEREEMRRDMLEAPAALQFRRSGERGVADHGWLRSRHTFSFGYYYDEQWQGFGDLAVINDDRVAGSEGFPMHGHQDMEIVSYVLDGGLEHKDSMGTGSVIRRGDVQRMSAGTGVYHSEFNASETDPVHFLQIWIEPKQRGAQPGYEQKAFTDEDKSGRLRLLASPSGRDGSLTIGSDAEIRAGIFSSGASATYEVKPGRQAWVHVAKGAVRVGGERLVEGDAAYTREAGTITLEGEIASGEVLVFDVAKS